MNRENKKNKIVKCDIWQLTPRAFSVCVYNWKFVIMQKLENQQAKQALK